MVKKWSNWSNGLVKRTRGIQAPPLAVHSASSPMSCEGGELRGGGRVEKGEGEGRREELGGA